MLYWHIKPALNLGLLYTHTRQVWPALNIVTSCQTKLYWTHTTDINQTEWLLPKMCHDIAAIYYLYLTPPFPRSILSKDRLPWEVSTSRGSLSFQKIDYPERLVPPRVAYPSRDRPPSSRLQTGPCASRPAALLWAWRLLLSTDSQ